MLETLQWATSSWWLLFKIAFLAWFVVLPLLAFTALCIVGTIESLPSFVKIIHHHRRKLVKGEKKDATS